MACNWKRGSAGRWAMLIACAIVSTIVCTDAFALDAPIDPWAEAEWRLPLTGLQRSAVRSVKLVEQTMLPSTGGPAQAASIRESHVVFDGDGRVERVDMRVDSRGERSQGFSLAYVWSGSRLPVGRTSNASTTPLGG